MPGGRCLVRLIPSAEGVFGIRHCSRHKEAEEERLPLEKACDLALRRVVSSLKPRCVIGVGGFAAKRAAKALEGFPVEFMELLHPSPANPLANKGWHKAADELLRRLAAR